MHSTGTGTFFLGYSPTPESEERHVHLLNQVCVVGIWKYNIIKLCDFSNSYGKCCAEPDQDFLALCTYLLGYSTGEIKMAKVMLKNLSLYQYQV